MTAMTYRLPMPPSVNKLYSNVPGKGRVLTARYRTWRRAAMNELLTQPRERIEGPVTLRLLLPRAKRKGDASNRFKAVEDILVHMGLIDDDRFVESGSFAWADVPECQVTVEAAAQGRAA